MRQLSQKLGLHDGSAFVVLAGRISLIVSSAVLLGAGVLGLWAFMALIGAVIRRDWADARWAGLWLGFGLVVAMVASIGFVTSLDALDMVID